MASFKQYTASGGASENFSIPTFASTEIKVTIDDVLKTAGTHYNITNYTANGGTVTWTSGNIPSTGTVRIERDTKILNNAGTDIQGKATYYAGSSIKADDLNDNQKQVLRTLEEHDDKLGDISTVANHTTNINIVAASIDDVKRYAEEYTIGSSAPSSPSTGDLWYDTSASLLKLYNGSSFTPITSVELIDEDNMASNNALKAPSQQSVKAYVDSLAWLDQSTKEDGSVIYWKNSSSKYFADNAQNIKTLEGGNF
jgi:hypothetical protein